MSLPMDLSGPASGLLCGALFGFVLERGGLGDGCTLTGQLRLKNWTVFNVMFTAIIVAATGLFLLENFGLLQADALYTPTTYLWATLLGGAMVGIGMGVGGYCPGTSVVAACEGRLDGALFFVGLIGGTIAFADFFPSVEPLLSAAAGPDSQTLSELLHLPDWLILAALASVAALVARLTGKRGGEAA